MQLINTTDKIEIFLTTSSTTNPVEFVVSFNDMSSTGITPSRYISMCSATTSVDLVPSPNSGITRQVRHINIFNADSKIKEINIQGNFNGTTRTIFKIPLQVNEFIQYTFKSGWKVFTMNGAVKVDNNGATVNRVFFPPYRRITGASLSQTYTTSVTQCLYMGKATNNHKFINVAVVNSTLPSGLVWSEAAIYKGQPILGTAIDLERCGVYDFTALSNTATGNRNIYIETSNINAGDDLWFVIGSSATTTSNVLRAWERDLFGGGFILLSSTRRPSSFSLLTGNTLDASSNVVRINWVGF